MELTKEKLSYLLYLYELTDYNQTITSMAGVLGISKSTLSKVLHTFYQEGITKEKGKGMLSEYGSLMAKEWQKEIQTFGEWLMEHVFLTKQDAKQEAIQMVLHMSKNAKDQLIQHYQIDNFLNKLDHIKMLHGDMLGAYLQDGEYPFAFTMYKNHIDTTLEISMSNEGFKHPGILRIDKGQGFLMLKPCEIEITSAHGKLLIKSKLEQLHYRKDHGFIKAKQQKDCFLLPISHITFYYNHQERLLQGHMQLRMKPSVQHIHMEEQTSILSIVFK